jgi:hypothetical protein
LLLYSLDWRKHMKKKIDEQTIIEAGNSICESIAELIEAAKLLGIDVEKYLNEGDDIDEEVDDGK